MQINEVVHGNLTREKVRKVLADYRADKVADYRKLPYSTLDFRQFNRAPMNRCSWIMWAKSTPRTSTTTWPGAGIRPSRRPSPP